MSLVFLPARPGRRTHGLHAIAPRLAMARDQHNAWFAARMRRLSFLESRMVRLERLVAHRDLQAVRQEAKPTARRDARYMDERRAKLQAAQHALRHVRAEITEVRGELAA